MQEFLRVYNIDAMVLGAVSAAIVLAFILLVIIFSLRCRILEKKMAKLKEEAEKRTVRVKFLEKSLDEMQILNSERQQKFAEYVNLRKRCKSSEEKMKKELEAAREKIVQLQDETAAALEAKRESEKKMQEFSGKLDKAIEEIGALQKRNEFWVDEISQLRIKYDALKLRIRKLESGSD